MESFPDDFIDLLKQEKEHKKAILMIEDGTQQNLVDSDGTHVLHLAARFNNWFITSFFINLGCELEVEDSSGTTPLMTALMYGSYGTANLLFHEIAYRLSKNSSPGNIFYEKTIQRLAADINSKLRDKSFIPERIGEILARIDCSLSAIINLHDPVITKAYLHSEAPTISHSDMTLLYENVMPKLDNQYIRTILYDGRWTELRIDQFCQYIVDRILNYQKTKAGREFLKRIFTLEIFHEDVLECLERTLSETGKRNIKIFLQYGLHLTVKEKYGFDLLACLFGNPKPKVIKLLKNKTIDFDGRGYQGNTPLHFAVDSCLPENVKFLLIHGADPNALNDLHETPIKKALCDDEVESLKLLLIGGADHLLTYVQFHHSWFFDAETTSQIFIDSFYTSYIELLASQLAIFEAMGLSIEKFIDTYNNLSSPALKLFYEECRQQLIQLQAEEIRGNLKNQEAHKINFTMFTILVEKPMKIARYVSDEDLQAICTFVKCNGTSLYSYYRQALETRAKDIAKINLCRKKVITVICECTGINDSNHLVVHEIASYLNFRDLLMFE